VKACPGDSCGWLFLDPRGRRRWCIMATCGNRSKVRAHAARQHEQHEQSEPGKP
jgi:predicted RNA-binding Zn ribbon-like protein